MLHSLVHPENTHLLHKGKYHCMADLLFEWFVFDLTCKSLSIQHKQSSWIQTSQTGGQSYGDTSSYEVSKCSLVHFIPPVYSVIPTTKSRKFSWNYVANCHKTFWSLFLLHCGYSWFIISDDIAGNFPPPPSFGKRDLKAEYIHSTSEGTFHSKATSLLPSGASIMKFSFNLPHLPTGLLMLPTIELLSRRKWANWSAQKSNKYGMLPCICRIIL